MDPELLVALMVLWFSTTCGLVTFLNMWFSYSGDSFHPHSVDVESRHHYFLVVSSGTVCKLDCPVKSISTFVAPRGSSSSKMFTVLIVMESVAGFLGSLRWHFVGDASALEATLSCIGFASLLLVTGFELDVIPDRFLEDKLIVTGWMIQKLQLQHLLPFELSPYDSNFRAFIRQSKDIYHLYEEDKYILNRCRKKNHFVYDSLWPMLHMIGACSYIIMVTAAIVLNDYNEEKVAWITGSLFGVFCFLGYLTGNYFPVVSYFRGWVLPWNPFLREPLFMYKLKKAVLEYGNTTDFTLSPLSSGTGSEMDNNTSHSAKLSNNTSSKLNKRKGQKSSNTNTSSSATTNNNNNNSNNNTKKRSLSTTTATAMTPLSLEEELQAIEAADAVLDSAFLRYARYHPKDYLRMLGHVLVMTELVALMTPAVAMGIQWVTALCDGPPVYSIIELLVLVYNYLITGHLEQSLHWSHCILKH